MSNTTFKAGDRVIVTFPAGDTAEGIYWQRSVFGEHEHIVKPINEPNMRFFGTFPDDRIRHAQPESYADYDGGDTQYHADLATLDAAAKASETATQGEWEQSESTGFIYSDQQYAPLVSGHTDHDLSGRPWGVVFILNDSDRDLMVNAARVASAWARMSKWLRGKGVV